MGLPKSYQCETMTGHLTSCTLNEIGRLALLW